VFFYGKGFPFPKTRCIKGTKLESVPGIKSNVCSKEREMNVVAYYRVSTDKQTQSGLGLEAQKHSVHTFCKQNGFVIVEEHTEEGISGKTDLVERPALIDALASIQTHGAGALVSAKIDRLSRDVLVQLTIEKELQKKGARFISAAGEGTEDMSPQSVLVKNILAAVAQNEAAMISMRTKAAMKAAKARGTHTGRPPFGMIRNEDGGFIPGHHFYIVIRVLYARFRMKYTYDAITEYLNGNRDCLEHSGKTSFNRDTAFRIVKTWELKRLPLRKWFSGVKDIDDITPEMVSKRFLDAPDSVPTL